jgi:hypothetical protein
MIRGLSAQRHICVQLLSKRAARWPLGLSPTSIIGPTYTARSLLCYLAGEVNG